MKTIKYLESSKYRDILKIMEEDPLLEKEKNVKLKELVKEKFSSRIEI